MSWDEFIKRFVTYQEEFKFKYKEYTITLTYSRDGEKCVCYIEEYNSNRFQRFFNIRTKEIAFMEFNSPTELLEQFRFEDRLFYDLWDDFE